MSTFLIMVGVGTMLALNPILGIAVLTILILGRKR